MDQIECLIQEASSGNIDAMLDLSGIYENQSDYERSYYWNLEAALSGDERGIFNVANMYFWGRYVEQNYNKAYEWFSMLYLSGSPEAAYYMGLYAQEGYLGEPDYPKSIKYYEEAIALGDNWSPVQLGVMYCNGIGVDKDYKRGFELYMLGYDRGDPVACANLGYCYETGQGVEQDMELAIKYYKEGAAQEEEHCIEALDRLFKTGNDISERVIELSRFTFQYFMDYEDGRMARVETTGDLEIPINIFIDNAADFIDAKAGPCIIDVCGVGSNFKLFASEEEYSSSDPNMAVISLIPSGTFPADPKDESFEQSPHIIYTGRVLDVEWNPKAGENEPNCRVYIETLEMTFSLYLRYEGRIEKGYVIHGVAWLFGDLEMLS